MSDMFFPIAKSGDGCAELVWVPAGFAGKIQQLLSLVNGLSDVPPAKQQPAGGPSAPPAAPSTPPTVRKAKAWRPAAPKKAEADAPKPDRNKKCRVCGHAFYDDSRTNVRRFCGAGGCRRQDGKVPGADIPHSRDGRALRVGDSDMSGTKED